MGEGCSAPGSPGAPELLSEPVFTPSAADGAEPPRSTALGGSRGPPDAPRGRAMGSVVEPTHGRKSMPCAATAGPCTTGTLITPVSGSSSPR